MKLYIKTKRKFLIISIFILLASLISIFVFEKDVIGNFLLGIFASTIIIAFQSDMASKVEESKLLIKSLRQIRDLCYEFEDFNTFSVDFFSLNFENKFKNFKNILNQLFSINNELGKLSDLNKKTEDELRNINEKILKLEIELHFIFKEFDNQNKKMKIIYFIEFYKIIKEFNFNDLKQTVSFLGWKIDSNEFYKDDYIEKKKVIIDNMEYDTSIQVYNKTIESKNKIEYQALKNEFEKYMKK